MIQNKKRAITATLLLAAVIVMTLTNYTKVFMSNHPTTKALYGNSVSLVKDVLAMRYQNGDGMPYGLGYFYPYNGVAQSGITDEEKGFVNGYNSVQHRIIVYNNEFTQVLYQPGSTMVFYNGDKADITEVTVDGEYLVVDYDSDRGFTENVQGSLRYVCIYNNEQQRYMTIGAEEPYESQVGLQGKVFCYFPMSWTMHRVLTVAQLLLALLLAVTITGICYGLCRKYHPIFGITFYLVTLLSPWIIGFSTNVYWAEFTWFVPMLIGLIAACMVREETQKSGRMKLMLLSLGMCAAVFVKSACGYEYICAVMLGGIVFLLTDLTVALIEHKDRQKIKRLFWATFCLGMAALLGFTLALLWHAYIRGDGDIYSGLRAIYYIDVKRRTYGDPSMFQDVYAESLEASPIAVIKKYVEFETPILLGVSRYAFLPLAGISFLCLAIGTICKKIDKQYLILYIWMGITAISWFVLGKAHSYIHTQMNYVLWYLGYMQIIFAVPVWMFFEWICKKVKQ